MLGLQSLADGISDVDGRVVATSGGGNHTNSAGLMVNVSTDSNLELVGALWGRRLRDVLWFLGGLRPMSGQRAKKRGEKVFINEFLGNGRLDISHG